MREALTWYVVVQVGALAVWPLVARALAPLDDRGWAVSKIAGLLSIAWIGHSTVLVEVDGVRLLTDPLLRPRIGPLWRVATPPEHIAEYVRSLAIRAGYRRDARGEAPPRAQV